MDKQKELTLFKKREIAQHLIDGNLSFSKLARKYNTSKATIGRISKKKEEYALQTNNQRIRKCRLQYRTQLTVLNDRVVEKIKSLRNLGIPVSRNMVNKIAKKIYLNVGIQNFKYSQSWINRIKKIYSIKRKRLSG